MPKELNNRKRFVSFDPEQSSLKDITNKIENLDMAC